MEFLRAVVFFAFLGVAFSKKFTEDLILPNGKECIAEHGLTAQFLTDNIDEHIITTEGNADLDKLFECIVKKLNAVDENNGIQIDVLKPILAPYIHIFYESNVDSQEAANNALEACKDVEGTNLGDNFIKILNCFVRHNTNTFSNL